MSGDTSPPETGRLQGEKPGDNSAILTGDDNHAVRAAWHQAQVEKQATSGVHLEDDEYEESSGEGPAAVDAGREGDGGGGGGGSGGVLDRVVSRVSTKSSWNPGPPPNGGVKAWTAGE